MPAQLKKIVPDPYPLHSKHIRIHRAQHFLFRCPRSHILSLRGKLRQRQCLPVQLPVSCQRQLFQQHHRRRHHVLRQPLLQLLPQLDCIQFRSRLPHHVPHQLLSASSVFHRNHRRLSYSFLCLQCCLDLSQFDPEPANLHLLVRTSPVLQHSFSPPPPQISRPVHPCTRIIAVRVRNESFRTQPRSLQIPPRYSRSAHIQLSHHSRSHRLQIIIQHIHPQIRYVPPNHTPLSSAHHLLRQSRVADMHRRLRDPVHVHQHRIILPVPLIPGAQPPQLQRLASEHHHPQLQPLPQLRLFLLRLNQLVKRRRRLIQHRHSFFHQQAQKLPRPPRHLLRHHHQPPAIRQRSPHLPHRKIKPVGVKQRPHIFRPEPEPLLRRSEQTRHIPVRYHYTFRCSRRARRVDHIRRLLRQHFVLRILI